MIMIELPTRYSVSEGTGRRYGIKDDTAEVYLEFFDYAAHVEEPDAEAVAAADMTGGFYPVSLLRDLFPQFIDHITVSERIGLICCMRAQPETPDEVEQLEAKLGTLKPN
jgi:hypothetical protein